MGNSNSFLDASRTGNLKKVSEFVENYKNFDNAIKDEKGRTALILSSLHGNVEIVELLLKKGFDLEDKCSSGLTALLYASSRGYVRIVQSLLLNGADIEACDKDGATSLLYAAHKGHLDVVRVLLEKGANVQARNESGMSALIYASHQGFAEVVEVLLDAGADTEARGEESRLQVAIRRALLLKHESAAADGSSPVQPLAEQQRAIDLQAGGYTALMRAASHGYVEVVEVLLEKGADRDARTSEAGKKAIDFARDPPSHIDRTSRHDQVVQLLLNHHSPATIPSLSACRATSATATATATITAASNPRPAESLSLFLEDT
eukprot:gene31324-40699_t